jgi:glycosyltransferase involved in cell wall biosynthesis
MSNYLNEFKKLSEESGYRSNKCISDGILTRNARSPDIDIVIPTLNCKDNLKICLERIRSQEYPANLNVFIVDGGSTDGTLNIASLFKCSIIQAPGIYSDGNGGAKMLGDKLCKSNFIWHIDSDNFLVGQDVALKLIEPLLEHPECQLSVPFNSSEIHTKTRTSKFAFILNKYWNNKEIKDLLIESKKGMMENNYIILKDLNYGISNCVLFRKEALEAVGFFDNDIEVLKRLKEKGLAAAALVPGARFEQNFP